MKHYHKNPREITTKQFKNLRAWLDELGDLGGIVHDLNSDESIGGNMRLEAMGLMNVAPTITVQLEEPNKQGTVATGYYEVNGEQFKYRAVRWTPEQCAKANIVANKAGGGWDWDELANGFEVPDLLEWGFGKWELGIKGMGDDPEELWDGMPEFEQEDKLAWQTVKVHFANAEDRQAFAQLVEQPITDKTKYLWHPKQAQMSMHKEVFDEA